MAERSFKEEVKQLRLGAGDTFEGEGILAVTKALLQSGVTYVGGYQGAPVSHLVDVLADAGDILDELGVHLETCANEAGATAMLGASINYPIRGAVTFKSIVGTNVASDALSNLASPGVIGGALIIIGEDYGEGSSIIQERTHAYAMKSQVWLIDPRPDLEKIVDMVEKSFELSEASNTPVLLELRIRACHMTGKFDTKDNVRPADARGGGKIAPQFDLGKISLPPATYVQEKLKIDVRWPAAVKFVKDNKLNEVFEGEIGEVGILCQGGMYNGIIRALQVMGLADSFGKTSVPIYCMNVTYPMIPDEIVSFCANRKHVLVVEEGQPNYIEREIKATLAENGITAKVHGKDCLPMAGEYTGGTMLAGITKFMEAAAPEGVDLTAAGQPARDITAATEQASEALGTPVPMRPPGFCTGCPERPVFSAINLVEEQVGELHISADIGCHSFATLAPFNAGNTILGYGLGLASSTGLAGVLERPPITIMGDGGFWHNGLTSGVANHVFNRDDGVLVILKNGYSSATGHQAIPSSGKNFRGQPVEMDIEKALRGVGVNWIKTVHTYRVGRMIDTLKDAIRQTGKGLRVIIAEGECMLAKQRREKPQKAAALKAGERLVVPRFGVDEETCTGDHSCIRLSGCPTLTIKPTSDPLRKDPVAHITNGCVGCGNCGEVAHAAILCPSFYKAEVVRNPGRFEGLLHRIRRAVIGRLAGARA